jgi:hypothetical protein
MLCVYSTSLLLLLLKDSVYAIYNECSTNLFHAYAGNSSSEKTSELGASLRALFSTHRVKQTKLIIWSQAVFYQTKPGIC